jgi:hypothetical protein
VNVAARLEGLAKPGGICISDGAHRQVRGKFDVAFEDAGERQLKNIARPVRVFQVALDDARPAKPISQHNVPSAVRRRWSTPARAMGAAVLLIAGAVYFHLGRAPVQPSDQLAKPSERFSIVVLPFANLSGDANQDYLADVITDELTTGSRVFGAVLSSPSQPLSLTRASQSTCGRSARISVCAMRWKAACSRVATGCV